MATTQKAATNEAARSKLLPSMFSHVPATIGMAAVALYAIGAVGSAGRLRASHVDISQGFSLIPLERHLRVGIATLFNGQTLSIIVGMAMAGYALWHNARTSDDSIFMDPKNRTTPAPAADEDVSVAVLLLLVAFPAAILFAGITRPWSYVLEFVVVLAIGIAIVNFIRQAGYSAKTARTILWLSAVVGVIGVTMVNGFFLSDPLPGATITTNVYRGKDKDKNTVTGPLISVNDGIIYLGSENRDDFYQSVPAAKVVRFSVKKLRRIDDPSILQLLGIDFQRKRCLNTVRDC